VYALDGEHALQGKTSPEMEASTQDRIRDSANETDSPRPRGFSAGTPDTQHGRRDSEGFDKVREIWAHEKKSKERVVSTSNIRKTPVKNLSKNTTRI